MKQTVVGMYEAKTHLSKLVRQVVAGEEVIITSAGTPLAKLVACSAPSTPRKPGLLAGKVVIKPGFDELPPGFEDIFTGSG